MKAEFEVVEGDGSEEKSPAFVGVPLKEYDELSSDASKWRALVRYYESDGVDASDITARFFDLMMGRP